jgi:hypothetical protein
MSALCGSCRAVKFLGVYEAGKSTDRKVWKHKTVGVAGQMFSGEPFCMSGPENFVILN